MSTLPIPVTSTTPINTETGVKNLKPSPQKSHEGSRSLFHKMDELAQKIENEKAQNIQQSLFASMVPNPFVTRSSINPLQNKISIFKPEPMLSEGASNSPRGSSTQAAEASPIKSTHMKRLFFSPEGPKTEVKPDADESSSMPSSPFKKPKLVTSHSSSSFPTVADEVSFTTTAGQLATDYSHPISYNAPPTPRKGKSAPVREKALSIHEEMIRKADSNQSQKIGGVNVTLNLFAKGTFMNCYSIKECDRNLVENKPNSEVLVKLYHGQMTGFSSKLSEYMASSILNYKAVQEIKVPVSTIYNVNQALVDHCFIVEKIPHEVDLSEGHQMEQARNLFEKSFRHQVPMDLSFSNLRVQANGTVTLIDFVEKTFDFNNEQKKRLFVIQFLKSWCQAVKDFYLPKNYPTKDIQREAHKLLQQLTQGLEKYGFDESWNKSALDEHFVDITTS